MTTTIIITTCVLLLLAYAFDISASKTRIPSVILLLLLGWGTRQASNALQLSIPDLSPLLPVLGTIGLILIVLEGSLELELNRSKLPLIGKASAMSLLSLLVFSAGLAFLFSYFGMADFKTGLANAIPFAIISSAIAIPSARHLSAPDREFVTYESSLSDIFGVILFNFITLNDNIGSQSLGQFLLDLLIILLVSFAATLGLSLLLSKIRHHVKFIPITIMVVLIYGISKIWHLPGLIFILLFGLFLGNLDELKSWKFIQKLQPDILNQQVHKFRQLTTEIAFLVRALFFMLFGFLIHTDELLSPDTILPALGITSGIFLLRYVLLRLFGLSASTLPFIAPRGLITILLFLSIPATQSLPMANKSLVIQVIVLSALVMMVGMMRKKGNGQAPATDRQ